MLPVAEPETTAVKVSEKETIPVTGFAERVTTSAGPEGDTVTSVHPLQLFPSFDSVIVPRLPEELLSAQARTEP